MPFCLTSSSANLIRAFAEAQVTARVMHVSSGTGILLDPQRHGNPFGVYLQKVPSAAEALYFHRAWLSDSARHFYLTVSAFGRQG